MLAAPGSSLRERKKQATRVTIRRAALELVAQRGFANVTVEDIAGAADVSPRTVFNYFPSKEAVVLGFGPDRPERLRRRLCERPSAEAPLEAVEAVMVEELEDMGSELVQFGGDGVHWVESLRVAHADPHVRAAQASHIRLLEHAVAAGCADRLGLGPEGSDDPYCLLMAGAAVGALRAVMIIWARHGGDLPSLAHQAFRSLSQGLPAPQERKPVTSVSREGA